MKRVVALVLTIAACGGQLEGPAPGARADLMDRSGSQIGTATLNQQTDGVRIRVTARSIPPGEHGFHVHAVGRCEAPFTSAGGHFNPAGRKHGLQNPEGPHAGDLINLPNGWTDNHTIETFARGLILASLFDGDGSALVVHAGPDDYRTDPSGNSGDRIACGIIRRP